MTRRTKVKAAMRFMAPMVLHPPPKRRRPGDQAEAQMSFGGDIFDNTGPSRKTQGARRAAIEAALPGQLDRRAKDAAVHRALSARQASTFAAENKCRRHREGSESWS